MAFITTTLAVTVLLNVGISILKDMADPKPVNNYRPPAGKDNPNENPPEPVPPDNEPQDEEAPIPPPKPLPTPTSPPVQFDKDNTRKPVPIPFQYSGSNIPPTIPVRRLPPLPNVSDSKDLEIPEAKLVGVKRDALQRTYGCMLHSPITNSPITFYACKPADIDKDQVEEDANNFFEWLARKAREGLVDEAVTGACLAAVNLLPIRGLKFFSAGKLALTFGCGVLGNIAANYVTRSMNALQSIDGQGHLNIKYIDCSDPPSENEDDPTKGLVPANNNINECFVPIRNFKTNEPEQLGMRKQLQIIYSLYNEETEKRYDKTITVPNPKDDLDKEQLANIFPAEFEFGMTKLETSITPFGYIRIYCTEGGVDGGYADSLIDSIISNIVEGDEINNSRRYSIRQRDIITGIFSLRKAFIFSWEQESGKPPLCKTFTFD